MKKEVIKAIDIAKKLNTIENINRLKIPILDGFELLEHAESKRHRVTATRITIFFIFVSPISLLLHISFGSLLRNI